MPIEDLKVKPEILSPKPPSLASDEEFAAGTSTTSSPTVKQAKEKLVTIDTTQTITGPKVFTTSLIKKSTVIDATSQATSTTYNTAVLFRDKNGKDIGAVNNAQTNDGSIWTVLEARNKDNYIPSIGVIAPYEGSTGGFGYAPNTPDNAPANAIVTKDKIANMVTTNTAQTISASKKISIGGTVAYSRPIEIMMPTSNESNPTENKTREIAFLSSEGNGERYEGSLTHTRFPTGESFTGLRAGRLVNGTYKDSSIGVRMLENGTSFATAPSTPANPPNIAIVTADYVQNKFVTTNTAQTISGVKTFTANTIVKGNGAGNGTFTIKNDVTDYGTSAVDLVVATSNKKNQLLVHFQEGNKWCAVFEQNPSTKNINFILTGCENVFVPTPALTANNGQATTTAWFNSKMQVVSALPANPDPNVFYFIPG